METSTGKYYSTCLIFSPSGELLGSHRKMHLFDIDIPGKIFFQESAILSPGKEVTIVTLEPYGKIAIGICYDMRFSDMATVAARQDVFALVYPSAFNTTTGPLHWELIARARAVDNQVFVILCSQARDLNATYQAWGHSLIVDPWARVMGELDEKPGILYTDLYANVLQEARGSIPITLQRIFDVY